MSEFINFISIYQNKKKPAKTVKRIILRNWVDRLWTYNKKWKMKEEPEKKPT